LAVFICRVQLDPKSPEELIVIKLEEYLIHNSITIVGMFTPPPSLFANFSEKSSEALVLIFAVVDKGTFENLPERTRAYLESFRNQRAKRR
jgi:hypothetical protein